ncbi:unnamed protein product [Plutella xylostella]|uniref:(diamondback moth) hypothetical protein n=1 Tax=Plutella xylostella TaxID=51655 RepID=A0A8S4FEQ5_PLUXY|nr:unnamed protein product [Plutella xylostella]
MVIHRRASFGVPEVKTAHQLRLSVRMCQHESYSCFVLLCLLVGQNVSTSTMTSLVVMVVDEGQRVFMGKHTPCRSEVTQPSHLVVSSEYSTQFQSVSEFSDRCKCAVLFLPDYFTSKINNFLVDVRSSTVGESVSGIQIVKSAVDGIEVSWPHVLGGVDSESGNTVVDQLVHVVSDSSTDVI